MSVRYIKRPTVTYIRRPGLGGFAPPSDPTAGLPGGGPISYPGGPVNQTYTGPQNQFRYLADGTAQQLIFPKYFSGTNAGSWQNVTDISSVAFEGMKWYVDGIYFIYSATDPQSGARNPGWHLSLPGAQEIYSRANAMRSSGNIIYAPLPPGVDQTTIVSPSNNTWSTPPDSINVDYITAKQAASQNVRSNTYRIYDPFTWQGYQALPDGFMEPVDGGVWVLASDNVLDAVQQKFGIFADPWYWLVATHPTTGQERLFLVNRGPNISNIFTRLGKTGPMVISILGTVLAPFTLGISAAVAAVADTAIAIEQKKAAAAAAAAANQHQADVLQQQVNDQTVQVTAQADSVYQANQTAFLAAGYTQAIWNGLTLDQKTALLQQAAAGQLQPTPAAVAVAQQTQQTVANAIQSATVNAALGTQQPTSSGGVWLLLLGGGAALAFAGGGKK